MALISLSRQCMSVSCESEEVNQGYPIKKDGYITELIASGSAI